MTTAADKSKSLRIYGSVAAIAVVAGIYYFQSKTIGHLDLASRADSSLPGCVQIRSSYTDELKPGAPPVLRYGTGCLFRSNDGANRLFLLTTSHVSQGQNLSIGPKEAPLATEKSIVGRRSNNEEDIEVIELDPKFAVTQLGVWDVSKGRAIVLDEIVKIWTDGKSGDRPAQGRSYMNMEITPSGAFVLIPSWIAGKPKAFNYRQEESVGDGSVSESDEDSRDSLARVLVTGQLWSPSSVVPGMSGSPVIKSILDHSGNLFVVTGLASEFLADGLEGSYISSDYQIAQLMTAYLHGDPNTEKVHWHYRGGLYYRDYGNDIMEVNRVTPTSSALYYSGGGEGNNGGGGEGNNGGGGEGNNGGGGEGNNGGGGRDSYGLYDPSKVSIGPGILYHGKPVVAFHFFGTKSLIIANEPMIRVLVDHPGIQASVEPIAPGADLISILQDKAQGANLDYNIKSPEQVQSLIHSSQGYVLESMTYGSLDRTKQQILVANKKIHVHLQVGTPNSESIDFALNSDGSLVGSEKYGFQQIIVVKGNRKNAYAFDLSRLFFVDLMQILKKAEWMSNGEALDTQSTASFVGAENGLRQQGNAAPMLLFRQLNTGETFKLSFSLFDDAQAFLGPKP